MFLLLTYEKEGGAPLGYHSGSLLRYHYHTYCLAFRATWERERRFKVAEREVGYGEKADVAQNYHIYFFRDGTPRGIWNKVEFRTCRAI
jgi:hypothetical protein